MEHPLAAPWATVAEQTHVAKFANEQIAYFRDQLPSRREVRLKIADRLYPLPPRARREMDEMAGRQHTPFLRETEKMARPL